MNSNNPLRTTGDVRRFMLETLQELRNGNIDGTKGMATAAMLKVFNDSLQIEINAAKLAMSAKKSGHDFMPIVQMGQMVIDGQKRLEE